MKQQSENLQEIKGDDANASGVFLGSAVNDRGTDSQTGTRLTQPGSRPVRYRLLDSIGLAFGPYPTAEAAVAMANDLWPDQQQDEERSGKGWDIEVIRA